MSNLIRISQFDIIRNLIYKLENIRNSGINKENQKEAIIYFKCIFKYINIKFPIDDIRLSFFKKEYVNLFFKSIDELIIYGYYLNLKEYTFLIIDKLGILGSSC